VNAPRNRHSEFKERELDLQESRSESSSALVWTAVAIREAVGTAMFHAGLDAGIEAGLQRKSREEASEPSNAARRDAFNTTMSEPNSFATC